MILTLLPLSLVFPLQLLRTPARPVVRCGAVRMLRNFDRCELIIFTRDAALDASTGAVRSGVRRLIGEAKEASTLVALLEPVDRPIDENDPLRAFLDDAPCWRLRGSEPQVAEVTALRRTLCVDNPDGFGGSDGFGRAPGLAFGREPNPPRCVAIVTSLQETVAAIGAGMRTVGIPRVEGDWVDEAIDGVADACIDALGEEEDVLALRVDDLSTPGGYWLNPPLPRDAHGNMVDPETGLRVKPRKVGETPFESDAAAARQRAEAEAEEAEAEVVVEEEEEEEAMLRAALLDIDPRPAPRRAAPPRAALEVGPAAAAALLACEGGVSLLDVRQPGEYRLDGHVDGSVNIPAYTWEHGYYLPSEDFVAEVRAAYAPDAPLVLLCANGRMAQGAAAMLEEAAFTNVQTLEGGLDAWSWEAEEEDGVPPLVVDDDGEDALPGAWV